MSKKIQFKKADDLSQINMVAAREFDLCGWTVVIDDEGLKETGNYFPVSANGIVGGVMFCLYNYKAKKLHVCHFERCQEQNTELYVRNDQSAEWLAQAAYEGSKGKLFYLGDWNTTSQDEPTITQDNFEQMHELMMHRMTDEFGDLKGSYYPEMPPPCWMLRTASQLFFLYDEGRGSIGIKGYRFISQWLAGRPLIFAPNRFNLKIPVIVAIAGN